MPPKSKRLTISWKQVEDVLVAHLYAIRAIPQSYDVSEVILRKKFSGDDEQAELVLFYTVKGDTDNA